MGGFAGLLLRLQDLLGVKRVGVRVVGWVGMVWGLVLVVRVGMRGLGCRDARMCVGRGLTRCIR